KGPPFLERYLPFWIAVRRAVGAAAATGYRDPSTADPYPARALQLADAQAGHPVVPGGERDRSRAGDGHAGRSEGGGRAAPGGAGETRADPAAPARPHGRALRPEATRGVAAQAGRHAGGRASLAQID